MIIWILIFIFIILLFLNDRQPSVKSLDLSLEHCNELRGFLAISIIIHHANQNNPSLFLSPFIPMGSVGVGIFILLSGYGLYSSYLKKGEVYFHDYFTHRFIRILIPVITASVIYRISIVFYGNPLFFNHNSIQEISDSILPFSWYVVMLIYCYIIFYICFHYLNRFKIQFCSLTICILIYILLFSKSGGWWYVNIPFFPLGILLKKYQKYLNHLFHKYCVLILSSLTILVSVAYLIDGFCEVKGIIQITWYLLTLTLASFYFTTETHFKILAWLGNISYEIYLLQGIAIFMFLSPALTISNPVLYALFCVFTTVVLARVLKPIDDKLVKFLQ